ncbi:hypothetical protein BURMUCGD1_5222 [Burkholderia multivorans CGD1]|nr:hypothetical protein BURMUCGD1_5222 [Burkholderia multivorans CGD1]
MPCAGLVAPPAARRAACDVRLARLPRQALARVRRASRRAPDWTFVAPFGKIAAAIAA